MNKIYNLFCKIWHHTDLFPRASIIQKTMLACLQLIIILMLIILFQVYDNHKDINNNTNGLRYVDKVHLNN